MPSIRTLSALCLATATLVACDAANRTAPTAGTAAAPPAGATKVIGERRGWQVEAQASTPQAAARCLAHQIADAGPSPLSFSATRGTFTIEIGGIGGGFTPGGAVDISIRFEGLSERHYQGRARDASTVTIDSPAADLEDASAPFARSKYLEITAKHTANGVIKMALSGTAWAVNALDECRRLYVLK